MATANVLRLFLFAVSCLLFILNFTEIKLNIPPQFTPIQNFIEPDVENELVSLISEIKQFSSHISSDTSSSLEVLTSLNLLTQDTQNTLSEFQTSPIDPGAILQLSASLTECESKIEALRLYNQEDKRVDQNDAYHSLWATRRQWESGKLGKHLAPMTQSLIFVSKTNEGSLWVKFMTELLTKVSKKRPGAPKVDVFQTSDFPRGSPDRRFYGSQGYNYTILCNQDLKEFLFQTYPDEVKTQATDSSGRIKASIQALVELDKIWSGWADFEFEVTFSSFAESFRKFPGQLIREGTDEQIEMYLPKFPQIKHVLNFLASWTFKVENGTPLYDVFIGRPLKEQLSSIAEAMYFYKPPSFAPNLPLVKSVLEHAQTEHSAWMAKRKMFPPR